MSQRIFPSAAFFQPSEGEPVRSVVTQTEQAVVVAWIVAPGQRLAAHVHPHGMDTWTVLSGSGQYTTDAQGGTLPLRAGDVAVAPQGQVHGVLNTGSEPLRIISVVTPVEAGFALV